MPHCPNAKKATMYYSFANKKGVYVSDRTPIEVAETHEGANFKGGQCECQVYEVAVKFSDSFTTGNNCYGPIRGCRGIYTPRPDGFFDLNTQVLCRGTYDNGFSPCKPQIDWYTIDFTPKLSQMGQGEITLVRDRLGGADNCGDPPLGKCTIKVIHNAQNLFTVSGNSPCSFKVACDDECPPGSTKCFSTNYPGYCCLPCSEIAGEIKAIANQVRRLNRG